MLSTGPRAAGGLSPYRAPRGSGPLFPKNTTLASVWHLSTCHEVTREGGRRHIHGVKVRHCQLPARLKLREKKYRLPDTRFGAARVFRHLGHCPICGIHTCRSAPSERYIADDSPLPNRRIAVSSPPTRHPHSVRLQADVYVTACASGGREGRQAGGEDCNALMYLRATST